MVDSRWRLQWLGAVFSAAAMVGCGGGSGSAPEVRETVYGTLRGVDDSAVTGTYAWKGVPFGNLKRKCRLPAPL